MGKRPAAALAHGAAEAPLVAHLVSRLDTAAASLLDLVDHAPAGSYRHAVICLGGHCAAHATLRERGIEVVDLARRGGAGFYLALYRALRTLAPDLVHTRSLGNLDAQLVAALAGIRLRVHGEYGRQAAGESGAALGAAPLALFNRKSSARAKGAAWQAARRLRMQLLRRALCPLVRHYIAASAEQERWLVERVGAAPARVTQIPAGVDSLAFHPRLGPHAAVGPAGFMRDDVYVIGSVGRMDEAGNHATLVDAFLRLIASPHPAHQRLRLLIAGDGPLRTACQATLERAGAGARAWLPGERADTAQLMRAMDLMVLPARAGGCASHLLEAMASGLPVVATAVGVHRELVQPGLTGILVPPLSPEIMAAAIADYCRIPEMGLRHGARARGQVITHHSLAAMARSHCAVYDALVQEAARKRRG